MVGKHAEGAEEYLYFAMFLRKERWVGGIALTHPDVADYFDYAVD